MSSIRRESSKHTFFLLKQLFSPIKLSPQIDNDKLVKLLKDLVKIDSVNPSLVPGAAGEAEIAEYLKDWMNAHGLKTTLIEVEPGRPNVVGVLKGSGGGKSLMFNGHIDTVGADYMTIDAFNPKIEGNRLYGRGSFDMKGGLAASMAAVKAIVDSGAEMKGDVIIAGVCDEEFASIGTEHLMKTARMDAAIIGEPTGLNIEVAHKGFAWINVVTHGFAAHGSAYKVGVDAIVKMGHVLIGLEALQSILMEDTHPLVGPGSVHASIIEGGRELSTYPDKCKLEIERRLIPGETREDIELEMQQLLQSLSEGDPNFKADYEITFYRGPMEVDPEEEICRLLKEETAKTLGTQPRFIGSAGWMDTQIIHEHGIPAVAYGPIGDGAHAAVEWVDLDSVYKAAQVQMEVIKRFCA
ncbi:ArgE/DapE family deacylase [Candidatus Bathyarchaeota archaeon]|nr:ArgE/DapE family deacylase [Candidatus Bathyarchaeota archaeon]